MNSEGFQPDQPVLTVVVVSYNTCEMTLACLKSVFEQTRTPFELIVIDNASSDGSAGRIAEAFPSVQLMAETSNHGFAAANNLAVARMRGEYLLLLNPDTVVLDGALDRLLAFARARPEARIWGGRTFFGDGTLNPASCWRKMSLWNIFCRTSGLAGTFRNSPLFNAEGYGGWDRSSARQVDIVTGCLFLIRREDWQALGGFDPAFFMYGEEADLCLRAARDMGARPMVTPEARIIHYAGASEKVRADKMVRLLRAKRELIWRHFPAWQRWLALWLFDAAPAKRALVFGVLAKANLRKGALESARVWTEVQARRHEWRARLGQ